MFRLFTFIVHVFPAMETSDKQPFKIMINDEVMVSDDVTSPKVVAPAAETDSGPLDEIKNPGKVW